MRDAATPEGARAACRRALAEGEDLRPLVDAQRAGLPEIRRALSLMRRVRAQGRAQAEFTGLRDQLAARGVPVGGGAYERFLLLTTALSAVDRVPQLPVDARVQEFFFKKFAMYAGGRTGEPPAVDDAGFVAMCRIAALTRFPAGQLDWEVSGVPRSWLLKVPPARLPKLVSVISFELGGFAPMFFSHLDPHRPNRGMLLERESLRSYHRMARSMALQPNIKGFITASWFHSPDTFDVSPHLAWANEVFLDHGGYVFPLGAVDPQCGVLYRSPERQQAYERGTFIPTEALVIWPRSAMLAWAEKHQDLADAREAPQRSLAGARA